MSPDLPPPVARFFAADKAASLRDCFAPDATVRDEGRSMAGLPAIEAWHAEAQAKYRHTHEPLRVQARDGRLVVTSLVTGQFPGSPAEIDFAFRLRDGLIVDLEAA
ncbi:nuclear transport factor 2 family protein [Falsiroseomonas selenitidurans]|uniref:Nuclear transport factor 2 family protein n=1 Tax=Falsiroseomonas selenitidurans TaxID=2716335 RepID=A0ABX1E5U4_9PROT|nr:nuclear transport factor 2 family protein [Falsiroseomonas selenitidurans]NKC31148.1 nuclear transport factor 2 family protein [Falsiroseomonas selenitidurans]